MKEIKLKDICMYWFKQGTTTANLELIQDCMETINKGVDDDPIKVLNELVLMFLKLNIGAGKHLIEENPTLEKLIDSNDIIYMEDEENDTTTSD